MVVILVALCIFNKLVYKSWLNPIVIQSLVWLGYYLLLQSNIGAYDVYLKNVEPFILFQSLAFSMGGFICALFARSPSISRRVQVGSDAVSTAQQNTAILYPVVIVVLLAAIGYILADIGTLSPYSIMDFRDALSEDDGKKVGGIGTLQLLMSVYVIVYLGVYKRSQGWAKMLVLVILFVYFTLLLGSKGQFVSFFCATGFLVVWQKKIRKLYLGLAFLLFVGVLVFLFYLRAGGDGGSVDDDSLADLFLIYTVTALPALYLSPFKSLSFGYYTFRVLYVWLNKFGLDMPVAPVLSEWVVTPLPTNVYSYIMPYYKDFGYWGIWIFPMILGFFHNFIYFKANKGSLTFLILSALFVYPVITQVWEENYFRQITNWVYITLVILLLTKLKLSVKSKPEQHLQTAV